MKCIKYNNTLMKERNIIDSVMIDVKTKKGFLHRQQVENCRIKKSKISKMFGNSILDILSCSCIIRLQIIQ